MVSDIGKPDRVGTACMFDDMNILTVNQELINYMMDRISPL